MIQTTLDAEILKGDKLRTTILSVVFALLSGTWVIYLSFFPEKTSLLLTKTASFALPTYLACAALYFLLMRKIICRYLTRKKRMPIFLRYLNAFIEINIPTCGIIFMTMLQIPLYVLLMPPVLIYFLFIILSALTLSEWICGFTGLVAALEYWGLSYYILNYTNLENIDYYLVAGFAYVTRGFCLLIGGIITGFVTVQIKKHLFSAFDAQKERDRIEDIFGKHVSPEVVSKLLSKNAQLSEYIPVCIMFLDIRNFTHFTEQNEPAVVVTYLNNLFEFMTKIIQDNKGIINKFLGDGFMAVFGAPLSNGNDVAHAVQAAMEIINHTEKEIKKGTLPDLKLGVGLHFGYALTGTIGARRRQEYTIIGDVVNSAAHIEQLNKQYNSSILISEDALNMLPEIKAELVGDVHLKHRETPLKLYKLA